MEKPTLRDTLQQLHDELEVTPRVDDNVRQLLHSVMQDIQHILEAQEGQESSPHSLVSRLEEATTQFEVSHPHLTAAVGRVIDALSSLGI